MIPRTGIFKRWKQLPQLQKRKHNRDVRELWRNRRKKEKRQRVEIPRMRKRTMDGHKSREQTSGMEQIKPKKNGSIAKKES